MPLGNYTSQFFANVYLAELDYFIKHHLRAKYYIRYVDDFIILHESKEQLEFWLKEIIRTLNLRLRLEIHPDKTKVSELSKGVDFVGFRNFYYQRLLRKRNLFHIKKRLRSFLNGDISPKNFNEILQGWNAYAKWSKL